MSRKAAPNQAPGISGSMAVQAAIINIVLIMGLLSSLFGCSKKPDPDEAVLIQLRKAGSDLAKPHNIEFYFWFPTKQLAEQAATRIRQTGFEAEVSREAIDGAWLCLGKKRLIPELATLQAITRDFNAIAKSLNGDYDGWETKVEK